MVWNGLAWLGRLGMVRYGEVGPGKVWQACVAIHSPLLAQVL